MPSSPSVVNLRPGEGGLLGPKDPVYLSVRDADTPVDASSINCIVTFSKHEYAAEALPGGDTYLGVFGDADTVPRPATEVSSYLSDDIPYDSDGDGIDDSTYGPVLTLEQDISGESSQRGVLFLDAEITSTVPVDCEFQIGIQSYTTGATSYFPDATYAGVVGGFVYWPQNTGVFVFFKDNGGSLEVEVTGPAQDASGTRLVSTTTALDWADTLHAPPSIRVIWDPTPRTAKVFVFATNESDGEYVETLLFEQSISALGQLQDGIRIGKGFKESPADTVCAFVGISSASAADFVEVHRLSAGTYGAFLLGSGQQTLYSTASRTTSDCLTVSSYDDVSAWDRSEVSDLITETSTSFRITRAAESGNAALYFHEPDLSSQKFLLVFQGTVYNSTHDGAFSSGAGVDIDDGTKITSFRFLDDFSDTFLGILSGASSADPSRVVTANFDTTDSSWKSTDVEIVIIADEAQGFCSAYVSEVSASVASQDLPVIDVAYSSVDSYYGVPTVAMGFLDGNHAGVSFGGAFEVSKLVLLPNLTMFYPIVAAEEAISLGVTALPDESGGSWDAWSVSGSGISTEVVSPSDPYWSVIPTGHTEYDFYYLTLPTTEYSPSENGITAIAKLRVDQRLDRYGGIDSVRIPSCALLSVDLGGELFAQLRCVSSENGDKFVFLSNSQDDYLDVLRQSEKGISISAVVDFTQMHVYMLSVSPEQGISVYIDYSDTASIHIPWQDQEAAALPSGVLTSGVTSVAVGAIPVSAEIETAKLTLGLIGASVGSGYNFRTTLAVSDQVLEDSIYGAAANVFVDVSDND